VNATKNISGLREVTALFNTKVCAISQKSFH